MSTDALLRPMKAACLGSLMSEQSDQIFYDNEHCMKIKYKTSYSAISIYRRLWK